MEQEQTTTRQMAILLFCGLLAPLLRVIPEETGPLAGAGGWVAPILALPAFLLVLWVLGRTFRRLPRSAGLPQMYRLAFGTGLGKVLTAATGLWLAVMGAFNLRLYGESFVSSIYTDTNILIFLAVMMAVICLVSRRGFATVCRMGKLFFYVLVSTVGLVTLLGVREVRLYNLWPVWFQGWDGLLLSAGPVLSVLGFSIPILYCKGRGAIQGQGERILAVWFALLCLLLSAVGAVMIGMFGWQTAIRLQTPFFSMAKEVTLGEITERIEAVVAAVWVFSDMALLAAQVCAIVEYGKELWNGVSRKWLMWGMGIIILLGASWMDTATFELQGIWRGMQGWNIVLCYGLPLLACLLLRMQRRIRHNIWGSKDCSGPIFSIRK
ncbi:MAG: spore germination protein [Clostridiales bacterium]|nr:spore germination protein [Clostridiales bacterium]